MTQYIIIKELPKQGKQKSNFAFLIHKMHIQIDLPRVKRISPNVIEYGLVNKLSYYNAAYLKLAQRSGLPLATCDKALQKAASVHGVQLVAL